MINAQKSVGAVESRWATGGRVERARKWLLRFGRRQPLGTFGAFIVLLTVLVAILAPVIAPYGVNETNLGSRLVGPSMDHLMGTDNLGRDQFSRIVYGTRVIVQVSGGAVLAGMALAVSVGLISGYFGGWLDTVIQRFVDAWMSFPTLVLLLALVAVLGPGIWQVIGVLALLIGVGGIRVVRAATLGFRDATFVEAARAVGAGPGRVVLRHIAPNLVGPVMVLTTLGLSTAILAEAALSFLGFGIPPPAPSWGRMLSGSTASYIYVAPWLAIFPGIAISVVVFGINMLGDALRDELDPRLRDSR